MLISRDAMLILRDAMLILRDAMLISRDAHDRARRKDGNRFPFIEQFLLSNRVLTMFHDFILDHLKFLRQ